MKNYKIQQTHRYMVTYEDSKCFLEFEVEGLADLGIVLYAKCYKVVKGQKDTDYSFAAERVYEWLKEKYPRAEYDDSEKPVFNF